MDQKPMLFLNQQQKLIMTPQLRQAISLLQMPSLELADYLEQQILENPLLETDGRDQEVEIQEKGGQEDAVAPNDSGIDWQTYLEEERGTLSSAGTSARSSFEERPGDPFVTSVTPSLQDYLLEQLHLTAWEGNLYQRAEYIIGNLDDRGYLVFKLDELAAEQHCSMQEMEEALALVQSFEPAGIGARSLKECLALQLKKNSFATSELFEMLNYLEDLGTGKLPKIAQALRLSVGQVQAMADIIRTLEPKPGQRFLPAGEVRFIVADIMVEEVMGQFIILVNDTSTPHLRINQAYRDAFLQRKEKEVRDFVEERLNAAAWLIKSVEQRRLTLYKVADAVMRRQEDFLRYGASCLKPLTMREVAEEIGMHESTVSRATANKYVQSPQGIYEFKYFFANRLGEEQEMSTEGIKRSLRSLLAQENPLRPYSDQILSEKLKEKGIEISRRTVAKYRDEMGIPAASVRKRYEYAEDKV